MISLASVNFAKCTAQWGETTDLRVSELTSQWLCDLIPDVYSWVDHAFRESDFVQWSFYIRND